MAIDELAGRPGIRPSHPGRILRSAINGLGVTVEEFATSIGTTRQTVHRILSGENTVTAEMAVRLGRALKNTPHF
jgi:antitoxin HigA-1